MISSVMFGVGLLLSWLAIGFFLRLIESIYSLNGDKYIDLTDNTNFKPLKYSARIRKEEIKRNAVCAVMHSIFVLVLEVFTLPVAVEQNIDGLLLFLLGIGVGAIVNGIAFIGSAVKDKAYKLASENTALLKNGAEFAELPIAAYNITSVQLGNSEEIEFRPRVILIKYFYLKNLMLYDKAGLTNAVQIAEKNKGAFYVKRKIEIYKLLMFHYSFVNFDVVKAVEIFNDMSDELCKSDDYSDMLAVSVYKMFAENDMNDAEKYLKRAIERFKEKRDDLTNAEVRFASYLISFMQKKTVNSVTSNYKK